jgi:hypothetical protein
VWSWISSEGCATVDVAENELGIVKIVPDRPARFGSHLEMEKLQGFRPHRQLVFGHEELVVAVMAQNPLANESVYAKIVVGAGKVALHSDEGRFLGKEA